MPLIRDGVGDLRIRADYSTRATAVAEPAPREWHVAPDGRPDHDGTPERRLDLASVLSKKGPVRPGDTVWLRGGTYRGTFVSHLVGTSQAPIVVRQFPGERATIDSAGSPDDALLVHGRWTWYWGFEVTNSDPQRYSEQIGPWPNDLRRGAGVTVRGPHVKFINMIVHDLTGGFAIWTEALDAEAYGNLIYNNGWTAPDRGHGHGIYTQNARGRRVLAENVLFNQFSHGIHAYGSERAALDYITLHGNVAFNNGAPAGDFARDILLGGGRLARKPVVTENFTYGGAHSNVGYAAGCSDGRVTGNYFGNRFVLVNCSAALWGNTFAGPFEPATLAARYRSNTYDAGKEGVHVYVRRNRHEPGRGHVIVYNWAKASSATIDLTPLCASTDQGWELRDAQNFYGPVVAAGRCDAARLEVPLNHLTPATPIGEVPRAPVHTAPEFAVFIVLPTSAP
jgi:hypothetical protein